MAESRARKTTEVTDREETVNAAGGADTTLGTSDDTTAGPGASAVSAAQDAGDRFDRGEEKVREMEQRDPEDLPTDPSEWPADESKYSTFGGPEGTQGYDEGPTAKLGPSDLRHDEDGSVSIEGEEDDDPGR